MHIRYVFHGHNHKKGISQDSHSQVSEQTEFTMEMFYCRQYICIHTYAPYVHNNIIHTYTLIHTYIYNYIYIDGRGPVTYGCPHAPLLQKPASRCIQYNASVKQRLRNTCILLDFELCQQNVISYIVSNNYSQFD